MADERAKSSAGSFLELVVIVAVALGLALGIQAFLVKPYQIPSESMVPTLSVGQRILVNRVGERFTTPEIGSVMVFHPPASATGDQDGVDVDDVCGREVQDGQACDRPVSRRSDKNFVKRVVAGPGDKLAVVSGHVVLNGKRQKEPFVQESCDSPSPGDFAKEITIPAGHWYFMGDNRDCSEDSRFWGPVPEKWIIGDAFATYWPPKRVGLL